MKRSSPQKVHSRRALKRHNQNTFNSTIINSRNSNIQKFGEHIKKSRKNLEEKLERKPKLIMNNSHRRRGQEIHPALKAALYATLKRLANSLSRKHTHSTDT
jgi:hypothetical protein